MWGVRDKVSLLLDHGHPDAWVYPLGLVVQEADIVVSRFNQQAALYGRIIQSAVSASPNGMIAAPAQQKLMDGFTQMMTRLGGG